MLILDVNSLLWYIYCFEMTILFVVTRYKLRSINLIPFEQQENMALAFQRSQVGMKEFGETVSVPQNPKAKLMYYLNCITTVLELDDLPRELRNYRNYASLDKRTTGLLVEVCELLSPDLLNDKCIFQVDNLGGHGNKFLEVSEVKTTMVATVGIMIGGKNLHVLKVMAYTPSWKSTNYDNPIRALQGYKIKAKPKKSSCSIM